MTTKKIYYLLLVLLFPLQMIAQNGIIRGKITDRETAEELIGATVMIEGTTTGTMADLDGNYSLEDIAPGTYTLKSQYISYESQVVTGVKVNPGKVTIVNFTLGSTSVALQEVVVEAKAVTRTEAAILTIQKKSATVIDGISAQQISRNGDSDAASALKRVTGLSVEGGKYIYIRGLGDRYSMTLLNGAEIPGLDPDRNTVQMDIFPSNIIENMIVHKSFSPDLPGSFTGGLVDIITRDFPEKFTFQFTTSFGFNTQSSFNKDYLSYEGGKTDWLAIDDGTRKIPEDAKGQIPSFTGDQNADWSELTRITSSFNKIWEPTAKTSFMDESHSIAVGNQVNFFKKKLGFIAGLTYDRKYNFYDNGEVGSYQLVDPNSGVLNKSYLYSDTYGFTDILWAGLLSASLKLNPNNKISLLLMQNQGGINGARYIEGKKPSDDVDLNYQTRTLDFQQRSLTTAQLGGEHYFESAAGLRFEWIGSYSSSREKRPDLRYFTNDYLINNGDTIFTISPQLYPVPTRFYRDMKETDIFGKIDLELPFNWFERKAKFKVGGSYVNKDRSFTDKRIDFRDGNNSYNGSIPDYVADDNIGQNASSWPPHFGVFVVNSELDDETSSYDATQSVYGGYVMVDIPLLTRLRAVIGARLEKTDINVASLNPNKVPGKLDNLDVLPAINLTYLLNERMNLRLSYSRTLARPSFRELAPYASFDFVGDQVKVGNPELKRTLIDNLDLRWEFFTRPGEIFSAGVFYKNFTNPIEKTFNVEAANPELTWRNVDKAEVYGLETEIKKQLDFIPFLKNFKLGANFTYVYSRVDVSQEELDNIHKTDPNHPSTRVMAGQSPYIVNALLAYELDSAKFNINISYNIAGKRLTQVIVGGTPDVYEQPAGSLNVTLSKGLGEHWSLKLEGINLLNPVYKETYDRWDENGTWGGQEYIHRSRRWGSVYKIGVVFLIG